MNSKNGPTQSSMFSSAEPLANHSASPDSGKDWTTHAATWPLRFVQFFRDIAPPGSYGKTSPVSCPVNEDEILAPLSGQWSNSGMASPTECWTLSTSEFPSGAGVCSLSDILETGDVLRKYYLSPKACSGILRRAEKRGKELPEALRLALEAVAASAPTQNSTAD